MEKCQENTTNNKEEKSESKTSSHLKPMKSIKSLFIIKRILSHLEESNKLKLILYNKHLQNKLGIDIDSYKKISGRYKIAEPNGYGKEYKLNTNILLYEGEYKNKKRNGKGKEYLNIKQLFNWDIIK